MLRLLRALAVLMALLSMAAVSCQPFNARPAADPTQSADDSPGQDIPSGERQARLNVPAGLKVTTVDFADVDTGYALFVGCASQCSGALFVTLDGGFSWLQRQLPAVVASNLQVYVVDHSTVLLLAEPEGWYVSRNTGRSFAGSPHVPDELALLDGRVRASCPGDQAGDGCARRAVWAQTDHGEQPVATQPPLPGALRDARLGGDARIWAVSLDGTTLNTAVSTDQGRTWRRQNPVTGPTNTAIVRLYVSKDGGDVWLVASAGTGPPVAWWLDQAGWLPQADIPSLNPKLVSFAAAGNGALAVALGSRLGYLLMDAGRSRWMQANRPRGVASVTALPDGTLVAGRGAGERWLGSGTGFSRTWVHVTVDAAS
jgi:hypothetical protein